MGFWSGLGSWVPQQNHSQNLIIYYYDKSSCDVVAGSLFIYCWPINTDKNKT